MCTSSRFPCTAGQRHFMIFLLAMGMAVVFTNRVNMSVVLVAMVNKSASTSHRTSESLNFSMDPSCVPNRTALDHLNAVSHRVFPYHPKNDGIFPWSRTEQGLILSSYYWIYAIPLLPMASVAHKWNSKIMFALGVILPSSLSLLIPPASNFSIYALMAVRAAQGFCESITCPSIAVLLGRWIPLSETSVLYNMAMLGALVGTIFGQLSAGAIADAVYLGWESVFYIHFAISIVWLGPWLLFASNFPAENRWISEEEQQMIGTISVETQSDEHVPWKSILRDPAVWAFILCMGVRDWLFNTMLSCLPQFLTDALQLSVDEIGVLSAIPYISNLLFPLCFSLASDRLMTESILSRTMTRKIFTSVGFFGTAICLILSTRFGCRKVAIVTTMFLGNLLISAVSGGFMPNAVDLTGRFCGVLFSMSNVLSTIACILSPIVADELAERGTLKEWGHVFDIGAGLAVLSCIIFLMFSSGYRRSWDVVKDDEDSSGEEDENEEASLVSANQIPIDYGSSNA